MFHLGPVIPPVSLETVMLLSVPCAACLVGAAFLGVSSGDDDGRDRGKKGEDEVGSHDDGRIELLGGWL